MVIHPQIPLKHLLIGIVAAALAVMAGVCARADLIGRYDFDDPGNPLADSSGNGNHLTIAGGTDPVWGATSGFGGTGAYDYSSDRLIAPIDVNPGAMPRMTWGAWVRTDSLGSGLRKVLGHDNGAWDRTLGLDNRNPNGSFRYTAFTGDDAVSNSGPLEGTPVPTSTSDWTFIAASHDQASKTLTVYVDLDASTTGDAVLSFTGPAGFGSGFNTFAIGGIRPDNTNEAWDGAIDQVFIYDEALDLATVTGLRDAGAVVAVPVISEFRATPGFINSGESAALSWTTSGADSLSIDMGVPAISGDSGSVQVSPGATTTYTLTASNEAGEVTAQAAVGVDVVALDPLITEFMASNSGALDDGDGNSSDWIEIHNPNPFAINLAGLALQDSLDTWLFPDVQVAAGGYLIVFASGQASPDYVDAGGYLHATFKLSASGEDLRLLGSDGVTVLSEFVGIPEQANDVSWGIDRSTGEQGFMDPSTPSAGNGSAVGGFVADTKFDIGRGFFTDPITVTISTATAGASIAYTTDGSEPSAANGNIVAAATAAVEISTTTTLRAMAFRPGWAATNVDTNTYIFLGDVIDQPVAPAGFPTTWGRFTGANGSSNGAPVPADYEMKAAIVNADRAEMIAALAALPTMSIVADPDDLFSDEGILPNPFATVNGLGVFTHSPFVPDRRCSVEWIQADGTLEAQIDCGVRLTGGWSRHYSAVPKKSLRLVFKSEFGPSKWEFPLFGEGEISEFDKVQMRATFSDGWVDNARPAQYLRDPFVRETFLAMGGAGTRGTFVHLYINGLYWGIYNPTERPDADYGASHFGGSDDDYDALKHQGLTGPGGAATNAFEVIDGTAARWQEALALSGGNMADPAVYAQFKEYVDVVSLADYFLVNAFLSNSDWPGKNWYAFGRRDGSDGGFKFSPWDSEYSLHELNGNRVNVSGTNTPARFYDRARANPEFRLLFADRIHRHAFNGGPLSAEAMVERYIAMAAVIEPAITAEAARWGDNPNTRQGNRDYRKSHWLSARNTVLNSFLPNRPPIALEQFRSANLYPSVDAPEFNQHGGLIDPAIISFVDPPAGTIYYTIDGSDPRLEGGAINPAAGSFEGGSVTESYLDFEASGWRYLVTPTGLGDSQVTDGHPAYNAAQWKHPDFDASAWLSGRAMLGYGGITGTTVNTMIGFGGNSFDRFPTTYFRKEFNIADASAVSELLVDVVRDDGAIVYVNGREIGRTNMDPGNRTYVDLASSDANPENEVIGFEYTLPPGVLRSGSNTLAIEVHQAGATSSDLGIDARVRGVVGAATIMLSASGTIKARLLAPGGEWSALTEAFFTVGAEPASADNLVISKIHYRPAAASQAEIDAGFSNRSDFEFLELYNRSGERLSLAGVSIGGGIEFVFPPDEVAELAPAERVVLVGNVDAFVLRYGAGPRIAGEFHTGKLGDDGEELVVRDAGGHEIWRFEYNDGGAWPDSPDGGGPALVLVDPDLPADPGDAGSWRPSASSGGAPGSDDRSPLATWLSSQPSADPLADLDGDGINQLLAFAIGARDNPEARAYLPSVSLQEIDTGDGVTGIYPVLSIRQLIGGSGFVMTPEFSSELVGWSPAELVLLSYSDHGDGTATLRYRSTGAFDPASGSRRFFRLSVVQSQP